MVLELWQLDNFLTIPEYKNGIYYTETTFYILNSCPAPHHNLPLAICNTILLKCWVEVVGTAPHQPVGQEVNSFYLFCATTGNRLGVLTKFSLNNIFKSWQVYWEIIPCWKASAFLLFWSLRFIIPNQVVEPFICHPAKNILKLNILNCSTNNHIVIPKSLLL